MKISNKGLSYIEVVIVLGISAILVGMVTITMGSANRANVNRAGEKLVSAVNEGRTSAMTRGGNFGYLNIYNDNGTFYYYTGEQISGLSNVDFSTQNWIRLCNNPVAFGFLSPGATSGTYTDLANNSVVSVTFKQSTGGTESGDDVYFRMHNVNNDDEVFVKIIGITGKTEYTLD